MASTTWAAIRNRGTLDFTSRVMSMSITQGRQKYLDPYDGGSLQITINNQNDYATNFLYNEFIYLTHQSGYFDSFYVQEIIYNDYPGNIGLPTATLVCIDGLRRAGRVQLTDKSFAQDRTYSQTAYANGELAPTVSIFLNLEDFGQSISSAQTYTGTVLNLLNIANATERGIIKTSMYGGGTYIKPKARNMIAQSLIASPVFGRSANSTTIAYSDFDRIQNGVSFINNATIQPNGLANQTASNASSVTTYGTAYYTSSTYDYTTTQALGNGQWIVNTFSDPSSLRFVISFTDKQQNQTAYNAFLTNQINVGWNLKYQIPGAVSETTTAVALEGWQINATPEQTTWTIYFSPLTYYQFFTLNSTTLGILDTSRLGW